MSSRRATSFIVGLAATALLLLAVGCGSESSDTTTDTTESTASSTTSSTAGSTTVTSTVDQVDSAVWPFPSSSTRFSDPVEAARSFAVDYVGFVDPVVGPFQAGDSRSGEVVVEPAANGPETTVLVRQLGSDDSWWVLGSSTPNLQLQAPEAYATISSPVTLSGQSTAFEATVDYQIRSSGSTTPLTEGFFNGGANGEMGPFSTSVSFGSTTATHGAIILSTASMENGNLWEATVVPVAFTA
jgi:hypothetical protein